MIVIFNFIDLFWFWNKALQASLDIKDRTLQETTFALNSANSQLIRLKDEVSEAQKKADDAIAREIEQRYCDYFENISHLLKIVYCFELIFLNFLFVDLDNWLMLPMQNWLMSNLRCVGLNKKLNIKKNVLNVWKQNESKKNN